MKIVKIVLILAIAMVNITNAQSNMNITGTYSLGSSSPDGASHLIILENGNYAITYFGGIQTGQWELTKDNNYLFTSNLKESKFELFGRYNKDLKESTKIFFTGFENSETFIQLRTSKEEGYNMQRVFNLDANCFSFPYVHTFKTAANSISLMFESYGEGRSKIITFNNSEGYNDFLANYIEVGSHEARPFYATFKDNSLYFEDNNFSERTPLNEDDEDIEFIRSFIDKEMNRETIYLNPFYNMFGGIESEDTNQDIHEHHVFNELKNAFIDTKSYVEGNEYIKSDESFHNMSIIYAYKVLKEFSKASVKFKINENSIFQVSCD